MGLIPGGGFIADVPLASGRANAMRAAPAALAGTKASAGIAVSSC